MRRIVLTAAAVIGCAVACWSQAYYEASGQTAVFTLAAGAKIGPAAIRGGSVMHAGVSGVKFTAIIGAVVITLPAINRGSADIALYDIAGRQMYRQRGFSGLVLRLETRTFAPGIYNAIVRVDGKSYSHRVAVAGRGN